MDHDKVKALAFRMVPKAITTMCTTVGALGIEIIKYFMNKNNKSLSAPHV
jgi:hypothetical protein